MATPKIVDNGFELIANAKAEEKAPITEKEFEKLMNYNTVDEVLKER